MGRKKNSTSELNVDEKQLSPLAQRLSELITDPNPLKDYLDCSIQAINQYKLGTSRPSLDNLCKIADFYHVSTDYLLGRTDVRNTDTDIQSVASYTALSESSIFWLHSCATNGEIQILNALIGHPLFVLALCDIFELKDIAPLAINDASFFIHPHEWKDGCTTINIQTYSELLEFKITEAFKEAFKHIVYPDGKSPKTLGESWGNNAIHQENDHQGR